MIDDDTRHRSYCLLLLSQVDVEKGELRDQAAKYGLKDEIDALLQFLGARGDVDDDRFPEWNEFQELVANYKVLL